MRRVRSFLTSTIYPSIYHLLQFPSSHAEKNNAQMLNYFYYYYWFRGVELKEHTAPSLSFSFSWLAGANSLMYRTAKINDRGQRAVQGICAPSILAKSPFVMLVTVLVRGIDVTHPQDPFSPLLYILSFGFKYISMSGARACIQIICQ